MAVVVLDENPALNSCLFQDAREGRRSYSPCETIFGLGAPDKVPTRDDRASMLSRAQRLVSPNFFFVFKALLSFANYQDGVCIPSHERISDRLAEWGVSLSIRTVRRALDELRRVGLVSWRRRLVRVLDEAGRVICAARASNSYGFALKPRADDCRPAAPVARSPSRSRVAGVLAWLTGSPRSVRGVGGSSDPPLPLFSAAEAAAADAFFLSMRRR